MTPGVDELGCGFKLIEVEGLGLEVAESLMVFDLRKIEGVERK